MKSVDNTEKIKEYLKEKVIINAHNEELLSVYSTYLELIKERDDRLRNILKRTIYSLDKEDVDFNIVTVLLEREDIKIYEDNFKPIIYEDMYPNIFRALSTETKLYKTIFLEESAEGLQKLEDIIVNGVAIDVDGNEYNIEFELIKEEKYINEFQKLKKIVEHNKLKWVNILSPYGYKAYTLKIKEYDKELENIDDLKELKIIYPDNIKEVVLEKILCWNIDKRLAHPNIVVRPTEEIIYFEHSFYAPTENVLVDLTLKHLEFCYCVDNNVYIITSERKYEVVDVYLLKNVIYNNLRYMDTNLKREQFNKNIEKGTELVFRNKMDIENFFRLYNIKLKYKVLDVRTRIIGDWKVIPTYDLKISDDSEFTIKNKRKKLYIYIEYEDSKYALDYLSYLKCELENHLLYYECIMVKSGDE